MFVSLFFDDDFVDFDIDDVVFGEVGEKVCFGIQLIEVGFCLFDVLMSELCVMMLCDFVQCVGMSLVKVYCYLVSFLWFGVVLQDLVLGWYELGGFVLQMGFVWFVCVDGVKFVWIVFIEFCDCFDQMVGIVVWGNQGLMIVYWMELSYLVKVLLKFGDVMLLFGFVMGLLFVVYLLCSKIVVMLECEFVDMCCLMYYGGLCMFDEVEMVFVDVCQYQVVCVEGMLLLMIYVFCMLVFDVVGEFVFVIVVFGQEGLFDIVWGGEIDIVLCVCVQKLFYEFGYSFDVCDV